MAQGSAKKPKNDHGLLLGLADDDHTQYLNDTRHANAHSILRATRITSDQNVATGTEVTVILNETTAEDDADGDLTHNTSTGIITVNTAGWYVVTASLKMTTDTTGFRQCIIADDSGNDIARVLVPANSVGVDHLNCTGIVKLAANATIEMQAYQSTGSTQTINPDKTHMEVFRIA